MKSSNKNHEFRNIINSLIESYSFDDFDYDDESQVEDGFDERNDISETNNISSVVDKIRQMSLDGLQTLKDDVDSKEYDFFKKVWLMCDKLRSEKNTNDIEQ